MPYHDTSDIEGTIVFTCGKFDLFHYGHLSFLKACAELGDHLVVGLNSDYSIKTLKGESRPIVPQYERKAILSNLGFVFDVVVFDEPDACNILDELMPDIFVKGIEYANKIQEYPEFQFCLDNGIHLAFVEPEPYAKNIHTSGIIQRIMEREIRR